MKEGECFSFFSIVPKKPMKCLYKSSGEEIQAKSLVSLVCEQILLINQPPVLVSGTRTLDAFLIHHIVTVTRLLVILQGPVVRKLINLIQD